jgi:hypothetical protein
MYASFARECSLKLLNHNFPSLEAVCRLSQDAWNIQPQNTMKYFTACILCSVCKHSSTFLDATLLSESILVLQQPSVASGHRFMWLVAFKLGLSSFQFGLDILLRRLVEAAEKEVVKVRSLKVLAAFYHLDFASMTRENVSKFQQVLNSLYLSDSIG